MVGVLDGRGVIVFAGVFVWVGVGVGVMVGVRVSVGLGDSIIVLVGVGAAFGPHPSKINSVKRLVINKMAFFAVCAGIVFWLNCL
ncbi:MAG TPA: hypothetical protein DCL08_09215 [Anaerolineaceae bacterium]|nr:MAG: hypothetical protein XE06_0620 [Anaerolineaceae bacterium 46_22]HAF49397.1 hypothetical protein [Anaerolineaceae bacterium]